VSNSLVPIQTRKLGKKLLYAIGELELETRRQAEMNLGEDGAEGPGAKRPSWPSNWLC